MLEIMAVIGRCNYNIWHRPIRFISFGSLQTPASSRQDVESSFAYTCPPF